MLKNKFWFVYLVIGLLACNDEKDLEPSSLDGFVKILTGEYIDQGVLIRSVADGYVVLANSIDENQQSRAKLIRLDDKGNSIWTSYFPSNDSPFESFYYQANSLTITDNGYIIIGDSINIQETNNRSMYLYKVNADGTEDASVSDSDRGLTTSEVGTLTGGIFKGVDVYYNGNDVITLCSFITPTGKGNNFLVSERSSANLSISCTRIPQTFDNLNLVRSLYQNTTNNNTINFGGNIGSNGTSYSSVTNIDKCFLTGPAGFSNNYSNQIGNFTANEIIQDGNNYAIVGTTSSASSDKNIYMSVFDKDGQLVVGRHQVYSENISYSKKDGENIVVIDEQDVSGDDEGLSIASATNQGGYIITGTTQNQVNKANEKDVILIKTNALGEVQWFKTFGDTYDEVGVSVVEAVNGKGYAILANIELGGIQMMALIKTDSNGNLD